MAYEHLVFCFSGVAGADLSTKQYLPVKFNATGGLVVAVAATDLVAGILQNKPKNGEAAEVMQLGISKVVASAAIAVAKQLVPAAADAGAVVDEAGVREVFGTSLTAATAAKELISVLLAYRSYAA